MQYFFFDASARFSKFQDWEFVNNHPRKIEDCGDQFDSIITWLETTGSEFSIEYLPVTRSYWDCYMVAIAVDERNAVHFKLRWC